MNFTVPVTITFSELKGQILVSGAGAGVEATLFCRVARAALFGWSWSRFFGPAPTPTLL